MMFRKKPVVIEAIQYVVGSESHNYGRFNTDEVIAFGEGAVRSNLPHDVRLVVTTMEGEIYASVGDWIIKGVKGEFYPCKPDIFAATYEPAESQQASNGPE
jgi:hypothetical protein